MRKFWSFHFLMMVLIISFCFAPSPMAQEKKEGEEIYTIKQGDTLWDISSNFFKDPFLWPKLWQRNPYITNPHWIYPGQPIRLVPLEELKKEMPTQAVKEPEIKKVEPPSAEQKPVGSEMRPVGEKPAEPKPVEVKPVEVRAVEEKPAAFPDVRSAGFISDIGFRGVGIILDNREGKNLMSEGDIVYLAFKKSGPATIGNKYTVFRAAEIARHPVTKQKIGTKYIITGNVQIIDQQGNFYTGKIVEAFDAIQKGDMLRPYMKDK